MMKKRTAFWLVLASAVIGMSVPGFAKTEEREKIKKVALEFATTIQTGDEGGDVTVTIPDQNAPYEIDGWEILNEPDYWSESNSPLVQVELSTDGEDYYFGGSNKEFFKLSLKKSGDDIRRAEFVKAQKTSNRDYLTVIVRLKFPGDTGTALTASGFYWETETNADGSSSDRPTGYAVWQSPADTAGSQIQIEVDGTWKDQVISTKEEKYNVLPWILAPGSYRFRVRNIMIGGKKSEWKTSKRLRVTTEVFRQLGGGFRKAADGKRWWWKNPDGSFAAKEWKLYEKKWYWFNADGYMATGWNEISGSWYYLDPETGAMYAKGKTPDGYRVDADGRWIQ